MGGGCRREAHSRQGGQREEGRRGGSREQPVRRTDRRMDDWTVCVCVCVQEFLREGERGRDGGGQGRWMCAAGLVKDDNSPLSLLERPAGPSGVRCQPPQPGLTTLLCVCACVVCVHTCVCVCVLALMHVYIVCVCARARAMLLVTAFDC